MLTYVYPRGGTYACVRQSLGQGKSKLFRPKVRTTTVNSSRVRLDVCLHLPLARTKSMSLLIQMSHHVGVQEQDVQNEPRARSHPHPSWWLFPQLLLRDPVLPVVPRWMLVLQLPSRHPEDPLGLRLRLTSLGKRTHLQFQRPMKTSSAVSSRGVKL